MSRATQIIRNICAKLTTENDVLRTKLEVFERENTRLQREVDRLSVQNRLLRAKIRELDNDSSEWWHDLNSDEGWIARVQRRMRLTKS